MIRPFGIDIGASSIKLIELREKQGKIELLKCASNNIPGDDIKTSLKDIIALAKPASKRANVSLSGPSVIVRYIDMPSMKKDELRSALKFEGGKYIPFDINEAILDCAVLDKSPSGSTNRVLLVAAKKDKVNSYLEMFKEAGVEIASIDVDTVAMLNAFQRLGLEGKKEGAYAMIDIGAKFSNMNIIAGGFPYFTRDMLWGGMDLTNRVKDTLGIDLNSAELLKRDPSEKKDEIVKAMMPSLEKFISEVRMSFDYFDAQFGKSVNKIYMSGGTAYLFNMLDFLKSSLEMEIISWNPFEGVEILDETADRELKSSPGKFAVAMGLALKK